MQVELPQNPPTKKRDEDDDVERTQQSERRTPSPISHENLLQGCDQPKNYSWMIDNLNRHIIIFKYYISFGLEWGLPVKVDTLISTSLRWISHVAQKVFYKGAKNNKTKFQNIS